MRYTGLLLALGTPTWYCLIGLRQCPAHAKTASTDSSSNASQAKLKRSSPIARLKKPPERTKQSAQSSSLHNRTRQPDASAPGFFISLNRYRSPSRACGAFFLPSYRPTNPMNGGTLLMDIDRMSTVWAPRVLAILRIMTALLFIGARHAEAPRVPGPSEPQPALLSLLGLPACSSCSAVPGVRSASLPVRWRLSSRARWRRLLHGARAAELLPGAQRR